MFLKHKQNVSLLLFLSFRSFIDGLTNHGMVEIARVIKSSSLNDALFFYLLVTKLNSSLISLLNVTRLVHIFSRKIS